MIRMNFPVRHNVIPFTIVYGSTPFWKNINVRGIERSNIPEKEHDGIYSFIEALVSLARKDDFLAKEYLTQDHVLKSPTVIKHFKEFSDRMWQQGLLSEGINQQRTVRHV